MGRILAIDYGTKRCGIAVTDPSQTIASALETIPTPAIFEFLSRYIEREKVDAFVIGEPKRLNNTESSTTQLVYAFSDKLRKLLPDIPVHLYDERLTSKMATRSLIESGQSKKTRRDKSVLDKVSATLLLQDFLNSLQTKK